MEKRIENDEERSKLRNNIEENNRWLENLLIRLT